jgi:hypothetical protein
MSREDYIKFLSQEVGLEDNKIERLIDGGFDDIESLELIEKDTLKLLGFKDADEICDKIKECVGDKVVESQALLNQDGE